MAKRRYGFDEDRIARFLKEGRGGGHGADYRPWLTVQDVSSIGRSTRIHGRTTGRDHHFLSDIETKVFLLLDWSDCVTDIREQFPLPREETRKIAATMEVPHPAESQTRTDIVMTTDFVINVRSGGETTLLARSVKPARELDKDRTLEKLEIERRYWNTRGIDWALITEHDLPEQRIKNLRWLHGMQSLKNVTAPHPGYWDNRCHTFLDCLDRASGLTIKRFLQYLESTHGFGLGEGLTVLRHLAATKIIAFDLDARFNVDSRVGGLKINTPSGGVRISRLV